MQAPPTATGPDHCAISVGRHIHSHQHSRAFLPPGVSRWVSPQSCIVFPSHTGRAFDLQTQHILEREGSEMMEQVSQDTPEGLGAEELECKICYYRYNLANRRPKVLNCGHRLCAKCMTKILELEESLPRIILCPFCRCATSLPKEMEEEGVDEAGLPDDRGLVAALALRLQNRRNLLEGSTELLLSPNNLSALVGPSSSSPSPRMSPSCLFITIVERGEELPVTPSHGRLIHSSHSLDSLASMDQHWTVWNCASLLCQASARALIWLLGLLYFSSLPLGVYLLIVQKTTLGVLLVSLVPSSLVIIMVYCLSQCVCRDLLDSIST